MNLALEQAGYEMARDVVAKILGVLPAQREGEWLEALREASSHGDPPLSKRARATIMSLFASRPR